MDDAEAKALSDRVRANGWRQGSKLPGRHDLFLADTRLPVTREAEEIATEQGASPTAVVHSEWEGEPPMIVVSQHCDLVADPRREPMAEAVPVLRARESATLPVANSSRYFVLDREERLVADITRRLQLEKALLPDGEAEHYFEEGPTAERFRAWCARRYSRVPLPDDFNLVVGGALDRAWKKGNRHADPRAEAMHPWRVVMAEDGGTVDTAFIVPFDEEATDEGKAQSLVTELIEDAIARLPRQHAWARERYGEQLEIRDFSISEARARASSEVSLRALMLYPQLAMEHLTYTGDEIAGLEPRSEQLL